MIILRKYTAELRTLGESFPVVGIIGPRQVGKTTLAKAFVKESGISCVYLDMEKPSDFEKLSEAEYYFDANKDKCIVIDEIQHRPELFNIIRSAVDEHRVPLRFIILGSSSPHLLKHTSETLAGRVSYIQMSPFSLAELDNENLSRHHFLGGFPESYLAKSNAQALRWLDAFIKTYIERDLPLLGLPAAPAITRRLWEMLAWQNGSLLNASALGNSLGLTHHTIRKYIDFIEGAFMLKSIPPFAVNITKRIVKSPKVYITDTGVLHRLLRVNSMDDLLGMPVLGASFEAYVLQQILAEKHPDVDVYFYRTHTGTEVDFVLTRGIKPLAAIEVKFSSTAKVSRGFLQGIDDLGTKRNYIIVPDTETYTKGKNITVCGIYHFLQQELPDL